MALASSPGSGNTWLRHLLEETTGIYTGSAFEQELNLTLHKFINKRVVDDSVIAVKTHCHCDSILFSKAILIIRDPFSALVAEWNRRHAGQVGHANQSTFVHNSGSDWAKYVYRRISKWADFNINWYNTFANNNSIHIVQYESLVKNTYHEMKRILNFLNMDVSKSIIDCAMTRKEGLYHRKKKHNQVKYFDSEMHRKINREKYKVYLALNLAEL